MIRVLLKAFLLTLLFHSLNCYAQNAKSDSIDVSNNTINFFEWYIFSAKNHKTAEYNPVEVKSKNGMTTLDFTTYFNNLKRFSFSDSLLANEKNSYNPCVQKLSKVKYSDYLKLTDLDQFEELNDDFTNYYRWTGGQEMFDGYRIVTVKFDANHTTVTGLLYDNTGTTGIKGSEREITVTYMKQKNQWKILRIDY